MRRIVAGMARMPIVLVVGLALAAVGLVFVLRPTQARASVVYSSPFFGVTAPSGVQEKVCASCGCESPSAIVEPGVSVLTGELVLDLPITSSPTMLGAMPISLRTRSIVRCNEMISSPPCCSVWGGGEVRLFVESRKEVGRWDGRRRFVKVA